MEPIDITLEKEYLSNLSLDELYELYDSFIGQVNNTQLDLVKREIDARLTHNRNSAAVYEKSVKDN